MKHLTTHYGEAGRISKVYSTDEMTYVTQGYENGDMVKHVYFYTLEEAEDYAAHFIASA